MLRQRLRVFYPVLVFTAGSLLAILSSVSGFALRSSPALSPAAHIGAPTPTAVPTPASVPGSTDGIMWMGLVITLVIVLPIILTRSTWKKS